MFADHLETIEFAVNKCREAFCKDDHELAIAYLVDVKRAADQAITKLRTPKQP